MEKQSRRLGVIQTHIARRDTDTNNLNELVRRLRVEARQDAKHNVLVLIRETYHPHSDEEDLWITEAEFVIAETEVIDLEQVMRWYNAGEPGTLEDFLDNANYTHIEQKRAKSEAADSDRLPVCDETNEKAVPGDSVMAFLTARVGGSNETCRIEEILKELEEVSFWRGRVFANDEFGREHLLTVESNHHQDIRHYFYHAIAAVGARPQTKVPCSKEEVWAPILQKVDDLLRTRELNLIEQLRANVDGIASRIR